MKKVEVTLAEPGAGLSALEMIALRGFIKPLLMRNPSRGRSLRKLRTGQDELEAALSRFIGQDLTERVLVPRPWFVEDSSRHWSPAMLFRHVGKVNGAVAKAIEMKVTLLAEEPEKARQRLRAVKPEVELNTVEEIENFRQSIRRLEAAATATPEDILRGHIIPHPWLRQLTYTQWIWFAGFHMQVHARQLEAMRK